MPNSRMIGRRVSQELSCMTPSLIPYPFQKDFETSFLQRAKEGLMCPAKAVQLTISGFVWELLRASALRELTAFGGRTNT